MQIEVYPSEKKKGYFSFRIDGIESHWYSTSEANCHEKIHEIVTGKLTIPEGTVRLPALTGKAAAMNQKDQEARLADDWRDKATVAERVAAFMSRGRADGKGGLKPSNPEVVEGRKNRKPEQATPAKQEKK